MQPHFPVLFFLSYKATGKKPPPTSAAARANAAKRKAQATGTKTMMAVVKIQNTLSSDLCHVLLKGTLSSSNSRMHQ